ncbi:MAG: SDR family oxidoreductase [Acidimicrobiales bacterium]
MDLGLAGKRALIAGASSGLGLGCAQALAAEGATVAIGSRSKERIDAAAATIDGAIGIVGDVSTMEGAVGFVNDGVEALGGIDILIANAGGPPIGNFASTDLEAYSEALNLNLLSTVGMVHTAVPHMKEQGWGRIVAITSISVRQPMEILILSNTARAGVTGFLKTVATEVGRDGITVNSLQPGSHATDRLVNAGIDLEAAAKGTPTRTIGTAEDFGKIATFLCSDAAKFVTGSAIAVDGGAYAGLQ